MAWTNVNLIFGNVLDVPRMLPLKFHKNHVKVTDDIFLIWTDVARKNVAWANVNLIVVPRMLPLKFHQNRVSNS